MVKTLYGPSREDPDVAEFDLWFHWPGLWHMSGGTHYWIAPYARQRDAMAEAVNHRGDCTTVIFRLHNKWDGLQAPEVTVCGRYAQTGKVRRRVSSLAEIKGELSYAPDSWNVAPTQGSVVLRSRTGKIAADWLTWGLSEGPYATCNPINARIETASTKPTFREAWRLRRAIIGVDGWYEWTSHNGRK